MLNFSNIEIGKKYERPWLAKEWGYRSYRAFAKGVFCPRNSNQIILFVTRINQQSLEQYGLMDIGLKAGGLTLQQSFEIDTVCCDTMRRNFSHEVVQCDITKKLVLADKDSKRSG